MNEDFVVALARALHELLSVYRRPRVKIKVMRRISCSPFYPRYPIEPIRMCSWEYEHTLSVGGEREWKMKNKIVERHPLWVDLPCDWWRAVSMKEGWKSCGMYLLKVQVNLFRVKIIMISIRKLSREQIYRWESRSWAVVIFSSFPSGGGEYEALDLVIDGEKEHLKSLETVVVKSQLNHWITLWKMKRHSFSFNVFPTAIVLWWSEVNELPTNDDTNSGIESLADLIILQMNLRK